MSLFRSWYQRLGLVGLGGWALFIASMIAILAMKVFEVGYFSSPKPEPGPLIRVILRVPPDVLAQERPLEAHDYFQFVFGCQVEDFRAYVDSSVYRNHCVLPCASAKITRVEICACVCRMVQQSYYEEDLVILGAPASD